MHIPCQENTDNSKTGGTRPAAPSQFVFRIKRLGMYVQMSPLVTVIGAEVSELGTAQAQQGTNYVRSLREIVFQ
jgi:hypothetical protein